jgi:hypothetical protein
MAFSYKASITIDHNKVGTVNNTDQTNFPVLVSGTYDGTAGAPNLKSAGNSGHVQNGNGYDIYFYSDSGLTTRIPAERETYNASTGAVLFWVNVSTVSHTSDTVIYVGYGDSGISTDPNSDATYGKNAVWDSSYKEVLHLPDGSSLSVNDSTSNANNGSSNTAAATTGQIDGGSAHNGGSFFTPQLNVFQSNNFSIDFWFKSNDTSVSNNYIMINYNAGPQNAIIYEYVDNQIEFFANSYTGSDPRPNTQINITDTNWHHIVYQYDGTNWEAFKDGVQIMAQTRTFNLTPELTTWEWVTANHNLDELRVSNAKRSADWITTEYNNESSPSTFYTMGSEQSTGGGGVTFIPRRIMLGIG